MEFISNDTIEITKMALDGLSARQKALSANVANAETPDYKRVDVEFEGQLQQILKEQNQEKNSRIQPLSGVTGIRYISDSLESLKKQNGFYGPPSQNSYSSFKPESIPDYSPAVSENGNNVSIDKEMTELMKNGTKYTALGTIEGKLFKEMQEVIKGTV